MGLSIWNDGILEGWVLKRMLSIFYFAFSINFAINLSEL